MKQLIDFSALQIKLASPETILSWSHGEVKKPETINYRSLKTEKDGLFDEKIFGPTKDYECFCGKYKRIRYKGIICDKCGVEVTEAKVRRERMGHIGLATPVGHIWFFKGAPSKLSLLLDISPKNINAIIYFSQYIVAGFDKEEKQKVFESLEANEKKDVEALKTKVGERITELTSDLKKREKSLKDKVSNKETLSLKVEEAKAQVESLVNKLENELKLTVEKKSEVFKAVRGLVKRIQRGSTLSEEEYLKLDDYDATSFIEVGMGAESLKKLVENLDLEKMAVNLRKEMESSKGLKKIKLIKRLKVVDGFRKSKVDPAWMFLDVLPVIPPDLRPMVQLSGGKFASSDLNDLYRRVINRNNRLKHLIELGAPEIILRNEKRMLQEAVDSLIDSSQVRQNKRQTKRPLKSLSEVIKGKQGRFRQNLLGKRVDYSGRSVIIVGPELKLDECGLPKDMALEMFKPYILHYLIKDNHASNMKSAKRLIDSHEKIVYDILEKVIKNHPVILNRAPTLHKLGMQAFYVQLVEGNAIRLHPCVCSGYNADFDGDQMAVHLPLTKAAQQECREKMFASNNLLKPSNGEPITIPNKEMAMGLFYYTSINENLKVFDSIFSDSTEARYAFQTKKIDLRQRIKVRLEFKGKKQIIETTIGRIILNEIIPEELRFMNESIDAKKIKEIVTFAISKDEKEVVAKLIDDVKHLGFIAATVSGLSVAVSDCQMIDEKDGIIKETNERVGEIQDDYLNGFITLEEKKRQTFDAWIKTTDEVAEKTWDSYDEENAVKIMINSGGTRASKDQVKQLAAMRGLVVDPLGNIVEMPTKSNFRQGLSIFEYVTSARGSRKGLTDSAIKTADAGYLTRRLCDVSHDLIIRMDDCGTHEGIVIDRNERSDSFNSRIISRFLADDVKIGDKVLFKAGDIIDEEVARKITENTKIQSVKVRSPLTCSAKKGLCAKCYGWDFSTRKVAEIGTPVGIVAAQSIGEPGTQLTMRVKHSGGIVGLDVTQGLPRVEEVLECRKPKSAAVLAEIAGKVKVKESDDKYIIEINDALSKDNSQIVEILSTNKLLIKNGDLVIPGQPLTVGSFNLQDLLILKGVRVTQRHIIGAAQEVYESQGIGIHDKHFEVIVRKMGDKVQVDNAGDTKFLTGEIVEKGRFVIENEETVAAGGQPAIAKILLLGITRASLFTSSWLSAASFQNTRNVLTDAATNGSIDHLEGLKENVIIGRLIPTSEDRAKLEI
jgi:DNA-directed RNA polymerase subunit beta'